MIASSLFVVLAALAAEHQFAAAQYPTTFGPGGNVSSLEGLWSSGSGAVLTGDGFANPMNRSFTYPDTAGVAVSFTNDGWFELSRYRFISNGSEPTCIKGVIGWLHGEYKTFPNGSLHLYPLEDGFQQIQDPCAAVSNFIENYNGTEYYTAWQVYQDTSKGLTARLYQFDGQPYPPMQQRSATPNMLPKQKLANATSTASNGGSGSSSSGSGVSRRSNAATPSTTWAASGLAAFALIGASVLLV
ncbi:ROT1 protein [Flagelloscypha sp. PMI_526]|nr:ROT1 protein [Flagelloscypha sp. PMI_526]